MDPKLRCLPIIPGTSENNTTLKHALYHSNMVITNIVQTSETKNGTDTMTLLTTSLIPSLMRLETKWDVDDVRNILQRTKIQHMSVEEILGGRMRTCKPVLKLLKAIIGMPDTMEIERYGFMACPLLSPNRTISKRNNGGYRFTYLSDSETVSFH
ncbi:hypothetical protein JTB14_019745 [Gonioctena quinquepunctata]|nr:hypothetical protein JTB14_019745 [Gonioctena quinquepunctata]